MCWRGQEFALSCEPASYGQHKYSDATANILQFTTPHTPQHFSSGICSSPSAYKTRTFLSQPTQPTLDRMPGLELFGSAETTAPATTTVVEPAPVVETNGHVPRDPTVYYNPRLDPKNYLEGPLSLNPATRLRQMLARPGIVVSNSRRVRNKVQF